MSRFPSLVFASLVTAVACAPEGTNSALEIDQEAAAISAMAAAVPGLEAAELQVILLDGLDNQTAPTAPETTAAPEGEAQTSSEPPRLSAGTVATEVQEVYSAPHPASGVQPGDAVDLSFEETAFENQYILDGFVTVRQDGHQIVGYGAAEFRSVEHDCIMEVWRDVRGTVDESGTLALIIESDTVVSGKGCEAGPFGEARWDVEDYLVAGSL